MLRLRRVRRRTLKPADLNRGKEKAEADNPGPICDVTGDSDNSEVCDQGDDVKNETDQPGDLLWSFSRASCHEDLLTFPVDLRLYSSLDEGCLSFDRQLKLRNSVVEPQNATRGSAPAAARRSDRISVRQLLLNPGPDEGGFIDAARRR